MSDHPTPEEIASLCLGTLPDERKGKVAYHVLFQGCEACRAHLSEPFRILLGDEPPAAKAREAQGRRIGDAIRTALRWEKAAAFLEEEGVEGVERARREYGDLEVFEALREKSWSLRHEAPQRMLELAQEAVRIAQELDAVKHGPKKVADHQCRAWANLGNA
ncbi:MAG TPA: hypothetical protein VJ725_12490, partial [Thermoanaerobaculia bacterium]|nr:hypothetical protein [Thermoanaerobaculia bacterium]